MSVLVLGTFDGVHKAHKYLISSAKASGETVIACTFDVPPALFFKKIDGVLTLDSEKEFLLKKAGADRVFTEKFTQALVDVSPENYIKSLVEKFSPTAIYAGYNHKFGKNASGNCGTLSALGEKYGFKTKILPPFSVDGLPVSSTLIRQYIQEGDMLSAKNLLGRNYSLCGKTVYGKQLGRTIGFPTVNTQVFGRKILPQSGVYATVCSFDGKKYKAMTNVGTNPTVGGDAISVETHLLGFGGDLYGKNINIEFLRKIRDEITFSSLDELKNQLSADALTANGYLQSVMR